MNPTFYLGTGHVPASVAHPVLDAYTARGYDDNEAVIGEWLRTRGVAAEMRLLTKGGHPDMSDWRPRLSEEEVRDTAQQSLAELGVAQVDAYLLHRDDPATPISDIAHTLRALVESGLTRTVGVSNWSARRVRELAEQWGRGWTAGRVRQRLLRGRPSGRAVHPGRAFDGRRPRGRRARSRDPSPRLDAPGSRLLRRSDRFPPAGVRHGGEPPPQRPPPGGGSGARGAGGRAAHPMAADRGPGHRAGAQHDADRRRPGTVRGCGRADLDTAVAELSRRVGPGWVDAGQFTTTE